MRIQILFLLTGLAVATAWPAKVARAGVVSGQVTVAGGGASGQGLSRTVVYLDAHADLPAKPRADEERPQIAQQDKVFTPDLLVVVQGTTVEFPNWDPFSHNVFSRSRAAQFDLERYAQGQSKSYTFNNVGVVQIFCNIHPQMKATIVVVPNRCFVWADAQGRFTLRDVPPGRHTLVAWNPRAGENRQAIEVTQEGLRGAAVTLTGNTVRESAGAAPRSHSMPRSGEIQRGLGVKRERLNLPSVDDVHPAPQGKR